MTNDTTDLVGEGRCWPCTVANTVVAIVVALVPVVAALIKGEAMVLAGAVIWAVVVLGYTVYRLVDRGYLPYSESVARWTGLHERIGPGVKDREED